MPDWLFPYTDEFVLEGRVYDSATITRLLSGQLSEERLRRINAVLEARTYNVVPLLENMYDMGNLAAVCRSADGELPSHTSSQLQHLQEPVAARTPPQCTRTWRPRPS